MVMTQNGHPKGHAFLGETWHDDGGSVGSGSLSWGNDAIKLGLNTAFGSLDRLAANIPEESSFIKNAENPAWRRRFLSEAARTFSEKLVRTLGRTINRKFTLVTDRAWDSLIVLDACRWDTLSSIAKERPVPSIISPGSNTIEWTKANFVDNPDKWAMKDVTLITANPYISQEMFAQNEWHFPFERCISVWKDGWDSNFNTVLPRTMVRETCKALSDDPSRRVMVHFMQPHFPPICLSPIQHIYEPDMTWRLQRDGHMTLENLRLLYEDSLSLVFAWALRLCNVLNGRIIVTSDHGNLFGEYGLFAHPRQLRILELVKVPWLEIEGGMEKPDKLLSVIQHRGSQS